MESVQPDPAQELEWIRRVQRGDREAFRGLVERHERRVRGLVFHLVRRPDEMEDLAQEIFVKAFLAIRSFDFRASFGTWLARIAVNHCYDYLRREKVSRLSYFGQMPEEHRQSLEARLESAETAELDAEERAALRDLVARLLERAPRDDRTILVLKEVEGMSVEEIAEILEITPTAAKVRLHRARRRMLEDLKQLRQGR